MLTIAPDGRGIKTVRSDGRGSVAPVAGNRQNGRMVTKPPPSRVVAAVATGVGTAAYYATPDVLRSRRARGWAKAGLTAVTVAASVPELRATWAAERERPVAEGDARPSDVYRSLPVQAKAVAVGLGTVVLGASAVGLLMAERWAFRHGQERATSGKRLPHTGPALLYGALAGGLWFLPTPSGAA